VRRELELRHPLTFELEAAFALGVQFARAFADDVLVQEVPE
jgi:hypothetical protein